MIVLVNGGNLIYLIVFYISCKLMLPCYHVVVTYAFPIETEEDIHIAH
jgi:hypothetical protein